MKFAYKDLLPSYLDGPNIRRHGELVDMSTEYLYDQLGVLGSWNNLTRPVLIKKEQEEKGNATYTVYVDLPYAIQSISITGDYTATVSFSEEDCVTSHTLSFPFSVDPESTEMIELYGFANATFEVCVETYEGYTYKKGYPENDNIMGDVYDHDRLLDMLGTVLTIPRRIYSQFQANEMGRIADTIPFLFGKRMERITTDFSTHWYVLSCTEDDYYYAERLQNFINDFMVEGLSLEKSKLRAVYDAIVTEELNFNDFVCHMDVDDMDSKDMACDDSMEANTYVYRVARSDYINLPVPVDEDLSVFLRDYVSVTKNVLVLEDYGMRVELLSDLYDTYYVGETVDIPLRVTNMAGKPLSGVSVSSRMPNRGGQLVSSGYTDLDGIYHHVNQITKTGDDLYVSVDDLLPYTGIDETFTTTVETPTTIPITADVELVSAEEEEVVLQVELLDSEEQPLTCDGIVSLLYNQSILGRVEWEDGTGTIISTGRDYTWQKGSTYTFRVQSSVRSLAPRGYVYETSTVLFPVTIPRDAELLPVEVDALVSSSTIDGISVQASFMNTSTSSSIALDGTVKLYRVGVGGNTLWDTVSLTGQSSVTLESPSGTLAPDTYNLLVELVAENPPEGYYYDNPITDTVSAVVNPVLIPVALDTTVTSATNSGVSVDVDFLNTGTSSALSLDGTITLSINDGTSTTLLDTESLSNASSVTLESPTGTTFTDGTYTLLLELNATNPPAGYYYDNPITASETITISSGTIIDCTTTSAWIRNNERTTTTAVLDNDGYITSDRGGNDYFTVCNDLVLEKGMTIEIDFMMKNSGMHGYGLQQIMSNSPNKIFTFNGTLEEKHSGGTQTTQSVATIPTNTLTTIKYEIDSNGFITLTDANGAHTSNSAFTDLELAQMQLCWKHWGTDKSFSIRRLVYTGGGEITRIFDWCDTLTNWKSTSGSTYPPELTTLDNLVGVKAPQNNRNMSYHMSYFDQALRLDEDTVIRCEVQCGALQNLYELGIITKDNLNNPYQYRTWAVFFITRTDHKIDNLNGNAVACNTPAVATWFPVYFIIHNRSITVIFNDANDTLGIHTTTVNYITSDDIKNNRCYLGMHSAEGSYPLAAIRSVSIVKLNTSQ